MKMGKGENNSLFLDACQNFCLNDGKCKKNSIGYVECLCKEQFSGERCEIRVKSRSSEIGFYSVIVTGCILVIIIIIIVIWMINARSQRDDFSSKLTSLIYSFKHPKLYSKRNRKTIAWARRSFNLQLPLWAGTS